MFSILIRYKYNCVALVGDASGSVDAITGEGLSLSFLQAEALAGAMVENDLSMYQRAHKKMARRPTFMARLLLLFLDSQNRVVSAPDRTASIAFYDLGRDPAKSVVAADGTFIWTIPDDRGMYIFDVALPFVLFAQFFLDGFHLLAQVVLALRLLHPVLHLALNLVAQLLNFELFRQVLVDFLQSRPNISCLERVLFVGCRQ